MIIEAELRRDGIASRNWGKLFISDTYLGETLEDPDRKLEAGGAKIPGETAIPRGRYRLRLTPSTRFGKIMPQIMDVPGFAGIRIHGGNSEADTEGCPLLGQRRTAIGVADCVGVNQRLHDFLEAAERRGDEVWLDVT